MKDKLVRYNEAIQEIENLKKDLKLYKANYFRHQTMKKFKERLRMKNALISSMKEEHDDHEWKIKELEAQVYELKIQNQQLSKGVMLRKRMFREPTEFDSDVEPSEKGSVSKAYKGSFQSN